MADNDRRHRAQEGRGHDLVGTGPLEASDPGERDARLLEGLSDLGQFVNGVPVGAPGERECGRVLEVQDEHGDFLLLPRCEPVDDLYGHPEPADVLTSTLVPIVSDSSLTPVSTCRVYSTSRVPTADAERFNGA